MESSLFSLSEILEGNLKAEGSNLPIQLEAKMPCYIYSEDRMFADLGSILGGDTW